MDTKCLEENCAIDNSIKVSLSSNDGFVAGKSSTIINGNISQLFSLTMQNDEVIKNYSFHSKWNQEGFSHSNNDSMDNTTIFDNNSAGRINIGDLIFVLLCSLLIIIVIFGNTLVILSVLTTRRLRTVTNLFVTSLAVADWLVGIFVMPPAVAYYIIGEWHLGWILCDIWISLDVLLCTASILSLCAISIDRYLAVTQPLNYSRRRRSKRLAMLMILVVWILALAITCPPILGWYEPGRRDSIECRYNENKGYVVFSAMGSFFLPMLVMVYVYLRISCVVARRHENMIEISVNQNPEIRKTEVCHDFECESNDENKVSQNNSKRSSDFSNDRGSKRRGSCPSKGVLLIEKLQPHQDSGDVGSSKNNDNHHELMSIGKKSPTSPWLTTCEKHDETKLFSQSSSMINLNNNEGGLGNQQLGASNLYVLRSRTQTKSLSTRISSLKRESKTTRTLSIVMFSFIACWLPFFIQYLMNPFFPDLKNSTVQHILTWLGWINSAINPFIYAFYSEDFRTAFYRLTLRRFCLRQKNNAYAAAYPTTSVR